MRNVEGSDNPSLWQGSEKAEEAEDAAETIAIDYGEDGASVVIEDPNTGEIIAFILLLGAVITLIAVWTRRRRKR